MRNLSTLIFSHLKGVTNLAWEQISELSNIRRVATHGVASHTGASGGASLTRFYRKVDVKLSEEPGKVGLRRGLLLNVC